MAPTGTIKGPGEARTYDGSPLRIGIVHARWNKEIISALLEGTLSSLRAAGVRDENIVIQTVPGSYELPYAVQRMYLASQTQHAATAGGTLTSAATDLLGGSTTDLAGLGQKKEEEQGKGSKEPFDAIIAIGALIKGSTMHFEYISDAVSHALMKTLNGGGGVPLGKFGHWLGGEFGAFGGEKQRGIITYGLAANRQNPVAGAAHDAVFNTFRRFRGQVLYIVPPMIVGYYVMDWAIHRNEYLNSKAGRAEFGDEEE